MASRCVCSLWSTTLWAPREMVVRVVTATTVGESGWGAHRGGRSRLSLYERFDGWVQWRSPCLCWLRWLRSPKSRVKIKVEGTRVYDSGWSMWGKRWHIEEYLSLHPWFKHDLGFVVFNASSCGNGIKVLLHSAFFDCGVPPMVMMVIGRDHKLYYEAYWCFWFEWRWCSWCSL